MFCVCRYRDQIVQNIIAGNCTVGEALPLLLRNLGTQDHIKQFVDEYLAKQRTANTHHTGRRCLVEVERFVIDDLAFRLAERIGFRRVDVSKTPPDPHPLSCSRPEASGDGRGACEWADVSADVKARVDPDGRLAAMADDYNESVVQMLHVLPPAAAAQEGEEASGKKAINAIAEQLGELTSDCRAVETAVPWVPDPEAPKEAVGAVLLIEERTGDGKEFWLSQIIGHRWCKARAGESERRSRWSFRIVDPRVIARLGINDEADDDRKAELIEQLDWHPVDEPDLLRASPMLMGTAAVQKTLAALIANDDDATAADDDDDDIEEQLLGGAADSAEDVGCSFEHPLAPPPACGMDATSFWDNTTFLCAWLFLQVSLCVSH